MKQIITAFVIFHLVLSSTLLSAENHTIDSLKNMLDNAPENLQASILNQLAREFLYTDSLQSGQYASRALLLSQKREDKKEEASALRTLGNLFWIREDLDKAQKYYFDALHISEKEGDKNGMADSYMNIGNVNYSYGLSGKSLTYYNLAADLYHKFGKKTDQAGALTNIGAVYNLTGENKKALEIYLQALKIFESDTLNNKNSLINTLNNIGNTYHYLGDDKKAMEYLLRSLNLSKEIGDPAGLALVYNNLASVAEKTNDPDEIIQYSKEGLKYALSVGLVAQIKLAYSNLATAYALKKDFKKAYEYQDLFLKSSQKMFDEEKSKAVNELEKKYQTEKKQKEIDLLNEKNKTGRLIIYSVSIGLFLIILLSLVIFNRYRFKQKVNSELERQKQITENKNMELERLSIVASETDNVVLILSPEGKVEWANESFTRLNGITIDELKRKKGETIFEISNNPKIRLSFDEAINEKKSVFYESLNLNKEGERIWESSTLTPIFDDNNKLKKVIIIDTDVSKRREAEDLLQQKNKDIMDSILYARRIQQSLLPTEKYIDKNIKRLKKS